MGWLGRLFSAKERPPPSQSALDDARWLDGSRGGSRHSQAASERSHRPAHGSRHGPGYGGALHGERSHHGSAHPSAHGCQASQQPRRELPVQQDGTISLLDAARDLHARRWGPAAAPAQAKAAHPTAQPGPSTAAAKAAPAAPAHDGGLRPTDERASSLPQPLSGAAHAQQRQVQQASGPGAPVSPDPTVPPSLRRVSSQPQTALVSAGSSALTASTAPHASGGTASLEGSRSSRHSSGSAASGGDVPLAGRSAKPPAAAAAAASKAAAATGQAPVSPPPPMRWHPALDSPPQLASAARAAAARGQHREREQSVHERPSPFVQAHTGAGLGLPGALQLPPSQLPMLVSLVSVAAATAAAAADEEEEDPLSPMLQRTASGQSVSLLTFLLKGPSAASSLAASRETSVRSGVARSREASVRSGSRRTPVGGLTLALSRESSVKGGQAACPSRERSVRDGSVRSGSVRSGSCNPAAGDSPLERSVSGGQRTYRGLLLADSRPGQPGHHMRRLEEAFACGSAEWTHGQAAGIPLTDMLDACEQPAPPAAALCDPFAPPAVGPLGGSRGSRASSQPQTCRPSETIPEEEREELLQMQPGEVGSWAERITTFASAKPPADPPATHHGGPDPLLLTAALEALATAPPCPGSGPDACKQLVGDSELATTTELSAELQAARMSGAQHPHLAGVTWHAGCGASGGSGSSGPDALHLLSSSWDVADAALVRDPLPPVQLGGSAPTAAPAGMLPPSRRGSTARLQQHGASQALPLAPSDAEWNRVFMRRWREVKKRAYLQALGLRALWRVNSPSDRHEPLELLTNDLPQHDNGMRRAYEGVRATTLQTEPGPRNGSSASAARPLLRPPSAGSLHKDPSLVTLLLGEVAEVC